MEETKENKRIVFDPNGDPVVLEEIMTFKIEELGKTFMAYTLGDDLESENVRVDFVEIENIDSEKPTIKKIEDADWELVQKVFNELLEAE